MQNFVPGAYPCRRCGMLFDKTDPRKRYCENCLEERRRESRRKHYEKEKAKRARLRAIADGLVEAEPEPEPPQPEPKKAKKNHVCLAADRCQYGDKYSPMCNYCIMTRELRTKDGKHQIGPDGKCDLFTPRGKRQPGWTRTRDEKKRREEETNANGSRRGY